MILCNLNSFLCAWNRSSFKGAAAAVSHRRRAAAISAAFPLLCVAVGSEEPSSCREWGGQPRSWPKGGPQQSQGTSWPGLGAFPGLCLCLARVLWVPLFVPHRGAVLSQRQLFLRRGIWKPGHTSPPSLLCVPGVPTPALSAPPGSAMNTHRTPPPSRAEISLQKHPPRSCSAPLSSHRHLLCLLK